MRCGRGILAVMCAGVGFGGVRQTYAQEATSASLPDQFQTEEMAHASKSKKKHAERVAPPQKQNLAPAAGTTPAVEEMPPAAMPGEEKGERSPADKAKTLHSTSAHVTTSAPPPEASAPPPQRAQKKARTGRRHRPPIQPEAVGIPEPVAVSLSVAQSMAITAPVPEYTYEMKRRNLSGNGICVVTVDPATGTVTNANMLESTGSEMLDKLTIQTFKSWRFKPGTVSQVRIPISYE